MRKFAWLSALVLLVVGSAAFAQPGWTRFSYPDEGFSINLPAAPDIRSETSRDIRFKFYAARQGDVMIAVISATFADKDRDIDASFDAAARGSEARGDRQLSRQRIDIPGAVAEDIVVVTSTGTTITKRVIYREGKLYQLLIGVPEGVAAPAWVDPFKASFTFVAP
ncbi:hypothetical protein GVN21_06990 [Caulobacter sp. SLTY]|uniref:hypothetical protein n=1 Tax=Caulobacter sp. SLTY TaxID=2683262 RepID=UPI001412C328|nr:hypothetical protein [Caulobacter sp. SLTY]NBB15100.1 hypothetical protein [Caulobacter sp. SLTY]